MHDFFTGKEHWGTFWRLLRQLGGDSRYMKALAEDEELAEIVAREAGTGEWRPDSRDFSLMHELVAEVRDRLGEVAALIADLPVGVKTRHKAPERFPRPETALTRATRRYREEQELQEMQKIEDWVEQGRANWRRQQAAMQEETADALGIEQREDESTSP